MQMIAVAILCVVAASDCNSDVACIVLGVVVVVVVVVVGT